MFVTTTDQLARKNNLVTFFRPQTLIRLETERENKTMHAWSKGERVMKIKDEKKRAPNLHIFPNGN